jgi:hypothetical protein
MMRLLILIISMKVFITNTCRLRTYCIIISNIMLFSIMSYSSFAIPCSFLIMSYVPVLTCLLFFNFRWQKMVGGSLHRSCSSAYRRVTGKGGAKKGGSSKGTTKKRRARWEEEEHEEKPTQEEPAQDANCEPKAEEASGGSTRRRTTLMVTLLVASTSEVTRDSRRGRYWLLNDLWLNPKAHGK